MNNTYLLFIALAFIALQAATLAVVWLNKNKIQSKQTQAQKSGNLALTKKQLYREIERHQETEITLQETQTYLQALIDSMPSILIGVSPAGTVTHWNKFAERATGIKIKDAFGKELQKVFPGLPITMEIIEKTLFTGQAQYKKNIKHGNGVNMRYTDLIVYPLLISEEVEEAVVMATDVSERVQIENRLMQSDKMQGLGEMAAGLAHEINNPLAGILHHVQNIKRRTSLNLSSNRESAEQLGIKIEDVNQYLHDRNILSFIDNIKIAGERASQIVNNMLNFARKSPVTFVETDLSEIVAYAIELTTNSFSQAARAEPGFPGISQQLDQNLPLVECAPIEIQQVIINLLRNAVQSFESEEFSLDRPPEITIRASVLENNMVLTIQDNGPGIDPDVRDHIFEPFFTTKDVGQGTGLGLSVCYFIINNHHNGEIVVENLAEHGTCFKVTLPLSHTYHSDKSEDALLLPEHERTEYSQQI